MSLLAFLLAAQAAAAPAPAAERAVLDAFQAACARIDNLDHARADAAASGWQEMGEDADPRIARLVALGRAAVGEGPRVIGSQYRRNIAGRELFLILSRLEDEGGIWGNGCRLYDIGAATAPDGGTLERWAGRAPTGVEDFGTAGGRRLWEPGWRAGVTFEISHVPAASPLVETLGFGGNIYIAQAIGGF